MLANRTARAPAVPAIVVLTGGRQVGKSTLCGRLARLSLARGWDVAGVVCPALFRGGAKIGIAAVDLRSGRSRPLAVRCPAPDPGGPGYRFDDAALAWADRVVASATPCDLLIVDELGPLELEQGRGFLSALPRLREGRYRRAVVVVRPELVEAFGRLLGLPFRIRRVARPHRAPAGEDVDLRVACRRRASDRVSRIGEP